MLSYSTKRDVAETLAKGDITFRRSGENSADFPAADEFTTSASALVIRFCWCLTVVGRLMILYSRRHVRPALVVTLPSCNRNFVHPMYLLFRVLYWPNAVQSPVPSVLAFRTGIDGDQPPSSYALLQKVRGNYTPY